FQAEAGIRDFHVTRVQTCALPIVLPAPRPGPARVGARRGGAGCGAAPRGAPVRRGVADPGRHPVRVAVGHARPTAGTARVGARTGVCGCETALARGSRSPETRSQLAPRPGRVAESARPFAAPPGWARPPHPIPYAMFCLISAYRRRMPTPYGSRGGLAFGAEELRVLRRALALALHPAAASADDVQDCLRLADAVDEATRESARLRAFLVADLGRYRAALPGTAAGYLTLLEEALGAGHRPGPDDLAALRALRGNPVAAALLERCQVLAEQDVRARLAGR